MQMVLELSLMLMAFFMASIGCAPFAETCPEGGDVQDSPCPYVSLMELLSDTPEVLTPFWQSNITTAPLPSHLPEGISNGHEAVYLDGFGKGYAYAMCGYGESVCHLSLEPHPGHDAFLHGWRDGMHRGGNTRLHMVIQGHPTPCAISTDTESGNVPTGRRW